VILAGPNGAGKSTVGPMLLRQTLSVTEFVNADVIAQGLSAFNPGAAGIAAGRVMLARIDELAERRQTFAIETTLASRTLASFIRRLLKNGYRAHLVFLWLDSPDLAVARVASRVRLGGHDIPEATIRRRYARGVANFIAVYRSLATTWRVYDNSAHRRPRLIAHGRGRRISRIADRAAWSRFERTAS
jgi:predicted ABC-type ATPase